MNRDDLHRGLSSLSREQFDRVDPVELEEKRRSYRPLPATHTRAELQQLELDNIDARLSKLDPARQRGRVRKARAEHRSALDNRDKHDATVRKIREGIAAAKAKVASLTEKSTSDGAKALLANKPAPDNSAVRKQIARENEKIEAGLAALELAESQRADLVAAERQAFAALCDEVHDAIGVDALADQSRAKKALAATAQPLAQLWANDIVRERLLGSKWSFNQSRARPFSGAAVACNFVSTIPDHLRTEELTESALRTAAERIAEKTLAGLDKKEIEQCD